MRKLYSLKTFYIPNSIETTLNFEEVAGEAVFVVATQHFRESAKVRRTKFVVVEQCVTMFDAAGINDAPFATNFFCGSRFAAGKKNQLCNSFPGSIVNLPEEHIRPTTLNIGVHVQLENHTEKQRFIVFH